MFDSNCHPIIGCLLKQKRREITKVLLILLFFAVALIYSNGNIYYHLVINSDALIYPSFCSKEADSRGPHQNVLSYSLYGNFSNPQHYSRYTGLIKHILFNISNIYPGAG